MNELEIKLIDSLARINFIFQNEELYTECIKNFEGFSILGKNMGPFEKGKKYKMKLFEAAPLITNNVLMVSANEKCDNFDVQRYAIAERDDIKLHKMEHNLFLNKVKEFKKFMEKSVKEGEKPPDFLKNYDSYLLNIIESRLLKLLRLSKSEISLNEEQRLTKSEYILYKQISKLIKTWKGFFLAT